MQRVRKSHTVQGNSAGELAAQPVGQFAISLRGLVIATLVAILGVVLLSAPVYADDVTGGDGKLHSVSLGDQVWMDADLNGVQDAGEGGLADVVVWIFAEACDSSKDYNVLTPFATTQTDATGHYKFISLDPGNYCLVIPQSALRSPVLRMLDPTEPSMGGDPDRDSNGQLKLTADFRYDWANAALTNKDDLSVDFGFGSFIVTPTAVSLSSFSATQPQTLAPWAFALLLAGVLTLAWRRR
jgi:hypothetical protein